MGHDHQTHVNELLNMSASESSGGAALPSRPALERLDDTNLAHTKNNDDTLDSDKLDNDIMVCVEQARRARPRSPYHDM